MTWSHWLIDSFIHSIPYQQIPCPLISSASTLLPSFIHIHPPSSLPKRQPIHSFPEDTPVLYSTKDEIMPACLPTTSRQTPLSPPIAPQRWSSLPEKKLNAKDTSETWQSSLSIIIIKKSGIASVSNEEHWYHERNLFFRMLAFSSTIRKIWSGNLLFFSWPWLKIKSVSPLRPCQWIVFFAWSSDLRHHWSRFLLGR